MIDKKNILILVEYFGQGGAERVGAMVAQMLADSNKFNVCLYSVMEGGLTPALNGVKTGSLQIRQGSGLIDKVKIYYAKISQLNQLKKDLKTDLTISSLWPVDWINAITGKDKKVAIIQINILNNEQNKQMVRFKKLVSAVYARFDKIILGGGSLVEEMTGFFKIDKEKVLVIQNPVNANLVMQNLQQPLPYNLEALFDKFKILVAANRLSITKNTEALIHIYGYLSDKENTKLLIIGEGEEKENLQHLISDKGLQWSQVESDEFNKDAQVYFLNFQKNIHNLIGKAKVFLFPTRAEGLPLTLLEAMSTGAPVIVSDSPNGGIGEVINGNFNFDPDNLRQEPLKFGGGYLMPIPFTDNPESLTCWKAKIEELLTAGSEDRGRISSANRERAEKFDVENVKLTWVRMIENLFKV